MECQSTWNTRLRDVTNNKFEQDVTCKLKTVKNLCYRAYKYKIAVSLAGQLQYVVVVGKVEALRQLHSLVVFYNMQILIFGSCQSSYACYTGILFRFIKTVPLLRCECLNFHLEPLCWCIIIT